MLTDKEEIELLKLLEEGEAIENRRNPVFSVVRKFKGRYIVMIGGSGSGKSYEIADRVLERAKETDDARILCVRAQQNQVAKSQFPLLWSRTPFHDCFDRTKSQGNERIFNEEKGEIIFSGLDDVDRLKSIFDITSVWIEEGDQVLAADVRELDRRLRGYHGLMQIYITFNPVSNLNYINKMYFSDRVKQVITKGPDGEHNTIYIDRTLTVRGQTEFENFPYYKDNPISDEQLNREITVWDDEAKDGVGDWAVEMYYNTLLVHSTYRDNKFIDSTYRQTMARLREDDPEEAKIYADGQWGVSGGTYFDKENVNKRIIANVKPIWQGYFEYRYVNHEIIDTSIEFVEDPEGYVKIYNDPKTGYPYVLSGDTASDGSDYNTGGVTDNTTGADVASIRVNFDEDLYARQMYCLGKWFGTLNNCNGNAMIAIEINHSTHPNKEIIRMGYDNMYIREKSPDSISGVLEKKYGWRTTGDKSGGGTRPLMLGMLRALVREQPHLIKDLETLKEMTTFVKNDKGKPVATNGYHDDMIIQRAINCAVREQQTTEIKTEIIKQQVLPHALQDNDRMQETGNYIDW